MKTRVLRRGFRLSSCTDSRTTFARGTRFAPPLAKAGHRVLVPYLRAVWTHQVSRSSQSPHGGAGGHRSGPDRLRRRARPSDNSPSAATTGVDARLASRRRCTAIAYGQRS
jgi:hypothetical protein